MATISVLMSTYNGQKFVKEQIESILNQSFSAFKLYIRDDGSRDDTLSILNEMAAADSRIEIINNSSSNKPGNLGFGESFSQIAKYALSDRDSAYFAFCDQDDYWQKDKLQKAYDALKETDGDSPVLFASNYYICNEDLEVNSTFNDDTPMKGVTFQNMFFEGVFPGFTMVLNRRLASLAFDNDYSKDIYYHDKWVSLIALGLGGDIIYDKTPLAKYRRYEGAASSTNLGLIKKIQWRFNKVLNGDFCPRTKQMLNSFKGLFFEDVSPETQKFLNVFTGKNSFKKVFYPQGLRRSFSGEFLLRIILFIGKI